VGKKNLEQIRSSWAKSRSEKDKKEALETTSKEDLLPRERTAHCSRKKKITGNEKKNKTLGLLPLATTRVNSRKNWNGRISPCRNAGFFFWAGNLELLSLRRGLLLR